MNIEHYGNNLKLLNKQIEKTIETINNDGLENNVENLKIQLKNRDFQRMKDGEISNIDNVINTYDYYDNTYSNMKEVLSSFKSLLIKKENSTSDTKSIDIELNSLIKTFDTLFNGNIGGEKLFDVEKKSGIGKDLVIQRMFDKNSLDFNGEKISDFLKKQIDNPNLDEMDNVYDFINLKQVEIGSKQEYLNNVKEVYSKEKLISQKNFENKKDLTGAILELNALKLNYEMLAKTISTLNELSLVKYI